MIKLRPGNLENVRDRQPNIWLVSRDILECRKDSSWRHRNRRIVGQALFARSALLDGVPGIFLDRVVLVEDLFPASIDSLQPAGHGRVEHRDDRLLRVVFALVGFGVVVCNGRVFFVGIEPFFCICAELAFRSVTGRELRVSAYCGMGVLVSMRCRQGCGLFHEPPRRWRMVWRRKRQCCCYRCMRTLGRVMRRRDGRDCAFERAFCRKCRS